MILSLIMSGGKDSNRLKCFRILCFLICLFILSQGCTKSCRENEITSDSALSPHQAILNLVKTADSLAEEATAEAVPFSEKAIALARQSGDDQALAAATRCLGDLNYYLDEFEKAIVNYKESAELENKLGGKLSSNHIKRLGDVAFCYDLLQDQDQAVTWYRAALSLAEEAGDQEEVAANLANLGRIETIRGNFQDAIDLMQRALSIDEVSGDKDAIATDHNTIGRIYQSWNKHTEAIGYFQHALEIDESAGNHDKVAIRLNSIGLSCLGLKEYQKALDYFQKALEIDKASGNEQKIAIRLNNIGLTYAEMGDYRQAITYVQNAVQVFKANHLDQELARGYHNLGAYYQKTNDFERSMANVRLSCQIAESQKLKQLQSQNYQLLSSLFRDKGDYKESLENFMEYARLKDEIFTEESDRKIADFMVKYETEKEKQKNELLTRDIQIRRERQVMLLVTSISIIVLLTLAVFLFRFIAVSNKRKRELAEQQAEKLKLELETRNKELTYNAMCIIKNNETMTRMIQGLDVALKDEGSPENLRQILHSVKNLEWESNWKEFEVRFTNVHKEFYTHLEENFPDLTPNERKICAFLRLNMSTKDIASLTRQSINSINVARTRLRRKLNLANSEENLISFLTRL
jgi:tetratricopeptide (TPR) repeat protein